MTFVDPYMTAAPMFGAAPTFLNDEQEQRRLQAYTLYEAIYWSVPETFKLVTRGEEDDPIYVPNGRIIVETMHRYTAPGLRVVCDPLFGSTSEQDQANRTFLEWARREKFFSKFSMNKRYGIMRGDWMWYFYADPTKPEGSRISIETLDPASVFPIYNESNIDEIIGAHIVEQILGLDGKPYVQRRTYRKTTEMGGPSPIEYSEALYEIDKWGGPGQDTEVVVQMVTPPLILPQPIDAIPIYHIAHRPQQGTIYGSSEMRGLERIMAAVNQSISDEELSLAMDGLGVYVTDAGTPIDPESGEEIAWNLGPARVAELPDGKKMERVNGVGSVTPYQDHIKYLEAALKAVTGANDVAQGRVDVQVAESGVALLMELGPILANSEEAELTITDVHTQMLFDLRKWFQAYEPQALTGNLENIRWGPQYGQKIPTNTTQRFTELMQMLTANVVSGAYVRRELTKIGYEFPDDTQMLDEILAEKTTVGAAEADAFGARVDRELDAAGDIQNET